MNINVANKNNVDPFSLGNAEGVQNLTDGGEEYYCKPVPKRSPHERDVQVGYYAHTNNKNTLHKQQEHPSISTTTQQSVHPGLMPVSDFEQTNYQIVNQNDMHVRDSQGNHMTYEDMYKKAHEESKKSFSSMTNEEKCKSYCDNKTVKKWNPNIKGYEYEYLSPCTDDCKNWGCANCDEVEEFVATQEGFFSGFSKFLNGALYEGITNPVNADANAGANVDAGANAGNAVTTCSAPDPIPEGYKITGDNHELNGFNITASCDEDEYYHGDAVVTPCLEDGTSYTLSGCSTYKEILKDTIDKNNELTITYKNKFKSLIDNSDDYAMKLLHNNKTMLNPTVIKSLADSGKEKIDEQTLLDMSGENANRNAAIIYAPTFQSGVVEKATPKKIKVRFSMNLKPNATLDPNNFDVSLDGGTSKKPVGASIMNNTIVLLTMNDAITAGQTIVLDYTKNATDSKNLSSENGYYVRDFTNGRIMNKIGSQQSNNDDGNDDASDNDNELTDCEKKWTATLINKYLDSNDSDKLKMSRDKGCMPPASALETAEVLKQASCVDEDQWNCVQVSKNGDINEERVDEKGIEGKLKNVPKGDEHLYMLKTKIVPPVCPKCPECPTSKCPICERKKSAKVDDEVEDDMEKNKIDRNETNNQNGYQRQNRMGLGFLAPPTGGSNQRQNNGIQSRGSNMRNNVRNNANLDFLQPRQNQNDIQRQMYNTAKQTTGAQNIADNSYYTSNARQALPKGRFSMNLGAFGKSVLGPLPRLTSFSAFGR